MGGNDRDWLGGTDLLFVRLLFKRLELGRDLKKVPQNLGGESQDPSRLLLADALVGGVRPDVSHLAYVVQHVPELFRDESVFDAALDPFDQDPLVVPVFRGGSF